MERVPFFRAYLIALSAVDEKTDDASLLCVLAFKREVTKSIGLGQTFSFGVTESLNGTQVNLCLRQKKRTDSEYTPPNGEMSSDQ